MKSKIHGTNFQRLDFRLLELFSAVMRLRCVTDAALALDIPQASASHGIARLRGMFRDELFIRSPRGMQPTQAAFDVADTVEEILRMGVKLEQMHGDFDPTVAERTFVIAASDVGHLFLVPKLLDAIEPYPNIVIRAVAVPRGDLTEALEAGVVDLVCGPYPNLVGGIKQQTLHREAYGAFCRHDNPYLQDRTLEVFRAVRHVLASGRTWHHAHQVTEARLRELLPDGAIRLITEHFQAAIFAVAKNGLLLTAPIKVLAPTANELGLEIANLPFELPTVDVKQYWHIRNDRDAGHRWFRSVVRDVFEAGMQFDPASP